MEYLSARDLIDCVDDFRVRRSPAAHVVSGAVSSDSNETVDIRNHTGPIGRRRPDHGGNVRTQDPLSVDAARPVQRLKGRDGINDAMVRGARSGGGCGNGEPCRTMFVSTVQIMYDGELARLKPRGVAEFNESAILRLASNNIDPSRNGFSGALVYFYRVTNLGYQHLTVLTRRGPAEVCNSTFKRLNFALDNIKSTINGTYRPIRTTHAPR